MARRSTAVALSAPYGRWLLLVIGCGIIAGGTGILWQAWRHDDEREIDASAVRRPARQGMAIIRRIGYSARGVILIVIGVFVILAAFTLDPHQVHGFGGALRELQAFPWVLGAIALGLMTYGVYEIAIAWVRRPSLAARREMARERKARR